MTDIEIYNYLPYKPIIRFSMPFMFLFANIFTSNLSAQQLLKPITYFTGTIKPDNNSQTQLDKSVVSFYKQWKSKFLKNVSGKSQSFVSFEGVGGKQCVSEGQGYGMIIMVLMAGIDPEAKNIFNNLYHYYKAHPSEKNKSLMAWAQTETGKDIDQTSASDGDIDIAYSLLLADKRWGSSGTINYLQESKTMINAIMQDEINHHTWTVLISDAVESESPDYFDTRTSDFMPSHFKAFEQATHDERWSKVVNAGYALFKHMQDEYSPDAGLVPDFIVNINKKPKPAPAHFLESKYDGEYNYNACRVPWRIGIDYLLTGDERSKAFVSKINKWIRETTGNDTYNLGAGYTLEGNDIKGRNFEALSFVAPFGVSAMVDKKNQEWLNKVWIYLTAFKLKDFDYYDNTIKLLNIIIMSGNYLQY